jgi:hypothetical protein
MGSKHDLFNGFFIWAIDNDIEPIRLELRRLRKACIARHSSMATV